MRYHGIFGTALACALAFSPAVLAAPLNIPPQQFAFDALGTEVVLPITADVDAVAEGEERVATGSAVGNLGDLQAKALAIAQALPLPKEQCANANGINVVVDAIHNASIKAEGNAARLSVAGTMTGYGCLVGVGAPSPRPSSRFRRRSRSMSPRRPMSGSSSRGRSSSSPPGCRRISRRCCQTR